MCVNQRSAAQATAVVGAQLLHQQVRCIFGSSAPRSLVAAMAAIDWGTAGRQPEPEGIPRTCAPWTALCSGEVRRIRSNALYTAETFDTMTKELDARIRKEEAALGSRFVTAVVM
jgi:hypothetical protein